MIFALATPVGKSAIAVIRVAGEGCHKKINASLDRPISSFGRVFLRDLRSREGFLIVVCWFFIRVRKVTAVRIWLKFFHMGGLV